MDDPLVVRARISQLGAEIQMIENLMDDHLASGEYGFTFTTLQASYTQILRESISIRWIMIVNYEDDFC